MVAPNKNQRTNDHDDDDGNDHDDDDNDDDDDDNEDGGDDNDGGDDDVNDRRRTHAVMLTPSAPSTNTAPLRWRLQSPPEGGDQ